MLRSRILRYLSRLIFHCIFGFCIIPLWSASHVKGQSLHEVQLQLRNPHIFSVMRTFLIWGSLDESGMIEGKRGFSTLLRFRQIVAQKVLKDLDWDVLGKAVVSEEGRRELNNLRRAFDDFRNVIETKFSVTPKPIDWDFYRARLNPGIVDMFQKSYESLKIPKYEDNVTPEYKKKFDALMVKVGEQEELSKLKIAECKLNLKRIREEKEAIKNMTVDEYFAKHPEVKDKFDEEIRNHNWGY